MPIRFDYNRRGGLTVDRDSLHESDGYKRQVEALKQLSDGEAVMGEKMTISAAILLAEPHRMMRGDSGRYPDGTCWGSSSSTDGFWLPLDAWQAITDHLTQPAQAVDGWQPTDDDVQAWRGRHNISLSLYDCRSAIEDARIMHHFDVRPAALPNANGKDG